MANSELEKWIEQFRKQFKALPDSPVFEISPSEELMLPMDDGIALRTIVNKPNIPGSLPTIIVRTCYPHMERMQAIYAEEFCKRGFAYVYQFCRGTGGSQGEWQPNVNERADGKCTLDWLDAQGWVESIGYLGSSYLALTGWAVADILPPKVKTMYLTHYGTDRFTSAYKNGLFRQDILTSWAMGNAGFSITADYTESASYRPQINVDENLWGKKLDWYRDWITNTESTDPYWQDGFWKLLSEIPSKVNVPVYIGAGWYDHHLGSALKTWEKLSEESKKQSVLRIGAWNHGFMPCVEGIEAAHLENNDVRTAYDWFNEILRKNQTSMNGINVYLIGADKWKNVKEYPFKPANETVLYLSDNTLETSTPEHSGSRTYKYNPDDPLIVNGAESLFASMKSVGSLPQPECDYRSDVLCFVSVPLKEEMDVLGKITVDLFVASDAEDTAFSARIMEVRDGVAYNIRGSINTLAFRDSEKRKQYKPGEVVKITIDMWDIAWRFQKGSQIRLDISSSCFPEYAAHTNYAGVWSLQEKAKIANQTIFYGGLYLSQISLPRLGMPL